jgi:hypothetical protein
MNDIEKILFVRTEKDNNYPGLVVIREIQQKTNHILNPANKEPLKLHENMIDAIRATLYGRVIDPGLMSIINQEVQDKLNRQIESREPTRTMASFGGRRKTRRRSRKYKKNKK